MPLASSHLQCSPDRAMALPTTTSDAHQNGGKSCLFVVANQPNCQGPDGLSKWIKRSSSPSMSTCLQAHITYPQSVCPPEKDSN